MFYETLGIVLMEFTLIVVLLSIGAMNRLRKLSEIMGVKPQTVLSSRGLACERAFVPRDLAFLGKHQLTRSLSTQIQHKKSPLRDDNERFIHLKQF